MRRGNSRLQSGLRASRWQHRETEEKKFREAGGKSGKETEQFYSCGSMNTMMCCNFQAKDFWLDDVVGRPVVFATCIILETIVNYVYYQC